MPALPLELVRQIVEDVVDDVNDPVYYRHLSVVSLTSRLLRHEAQRILFRDSGDLLTTSAALKKTTMFLDIIISSPERLALYVKFFDIVFDEWLCPESDETTALVQKLAKALGAMRNVKSLEIVSRTIGLRSLPTILPDTYFKLTSFRWSSHSNDMSESTDVKVDFLRRQDKIEHMKILGFIDVNALKSMSADILPYLRSLCLTYSVTETLLPGRENITSLRWVAPFVDPTPPPHPNLDAEFPSDPETISRELSRIKYLSYGATNSTAPAPSIQRIAPFLTGLVCLETCRGDVKELEALSQLPRLEVLVLPKEAGGLMPTMHEMIKVATSCKKLEQIDFEDDNGRIHSFEYCHSSKTPQINTLEESEWYLWINDHDEFDDD
ncbi:hypothetical protein D9619_009531 [Psilocybe cf. subviscida]|uniref:Uncharacterized protein n=1 Tax=Psilocybe cf. subviscida TaxID=2480587 RepID=A0A8H5BL73_9AGAR|nr:hypothetical protein D9619_009531 [Psilocybe cf. subviscida]